MRLWGQSRHTVYFLGASALFRDGLMRRVRLRRRPRGGDLRHVGGEVIIFGAVANIVVGIATMLFGLLDDVLGPKRVIVISLVALVGLGLAIFLLHDGGTMVFWTLGLAMTAFVGPAQAASRSFLARVIPEGQGGEIFGLYATTGRVVSFVSPAAFGVAIAIGAAVTGDDNTQYWGILGIGVVLLAGLLVLLPVKTPQEQVGTQAALISPRTPSATARGACHRQRPRTGGTSRGAGRSAASTGGPGDRSC